MRARRDASRAECGATKPAASLRAIENSLRELLTQIEHARQRDDVQTKRIAELESENHALHLALQKSKEQRAKDRQVVEMWRQYASQEAPATDVSTQEGAVGPSNAMDIPSSPPVAAAPQLEPQSTQEPANATATATANVLTQRVLPMSIDVDELFEYEMKRETEWPPSEERIASSSQGDAYEKAPNQAAPAGLFASVGHSSQLGSRQSHNPSRRTPFAVTANDLGDDESIKKLLHRTWHPSEFVLNPHPNDKGSDSDSPADRSLRGLLNGEKRSNCDPCSRIHDVPGFDVAVKRQRRNSDLSQQETPAGFWRTEFPDSDDARQDRVKAEAQWKAEGSRRLLEALNEGKYLFKDRRLREIVHARRSVGA